MPERAQRAVDLRAAHRRIPDAGEHRIVDFLDGGQRPFVREAEPARIDQPPMRQHLVAPDQDEVAAAATPARLADQIGKIADRHGGEQPADEGVVETPYRRAHVEHGLLLERAPEQGAPEGAVRGLQLAELFQPARQVGQRDGAARHLAVGQAQDPVHLEVERREGGARDRRHPGHHHPQRLAHIDARVDVEAAVGGEGCDQLEIFADGFEAIFHQRDLGIDDTRVAVDQQTLGGGGRAGQHHDVGGTRYQRERNERQGERRNQRHAPGASQDGRVDRRARVDRGARTGGFSTHDAASYAVPADTAKGPSPRARGYAAARIAALLTLLSTWLSNCWKLASKRWATSRAALS